MDVQYRQTQHLQFCKQLESLQQQLCECTHQSEELLASLYAMGKYMLTPAASCLTQLSSSYPEVGHAG
jgi:hypothetical protein